MIVEQGKQAVWNHAKEVGMSEDIALIAKYFTIKDVSIIGNGKLTYMEDMPRKTHRVPAIPTTLDYKAIIQETKDKARKYK